MPKNKGRGGKNYRRGKNENLTKRQLEMKEDGQDYAQVIKLLGSGRLLCLCLGDSKHRMGHIRGKMRRKVWIQNGDVVLVALREFQDEKCDVVYKFFPEEIKQLKNLKEIPEVSVVLMQNLEENEEGGGVEFITKEESDSDSESFESSDEDNSDEDGSSDEEEEEKPKKAQQPAKKPQQQQQQQQPQKKALTQEEKKLKKEDIDDI